MIDDLVIKFGLIANLLNENKLTEKAHTVFLRFSRFIPLFSQFEQRLTMPLLTGHKRIFRACTINAEG